MELTSIFLAAVGIGLLIFVHELGHFLAARLAGVRVEVFSLGFGPRLCGWSWRGTDFRLSLVPLGGFVMVAGQDPGDRRYPVHESLHGKTAAQRALFWTGGVLMNALFALVVFPLVFRAGVAFESPVVGEVRFGGAAWEAGLAPGDRVLEVAGKSIYSFPNLSVEVALNGSRPLQLLLAAADGERRTVIVRPQFNAETGLYELGITPAYADTEPALQVVPGGAAAAAGLRDGDLLVAIDGQPPAQYRGIQAELQPLTLTVRRDGLAREVTVTPRATDDGAPRRIGVRPLPRRLAGIRPGSALVTRLGLERGDVILAIDDRPFLSGDLTVAATGGPRTVWLVERAGRIVRLEADADAAERAALSQHLAVVDDRSLVLLPTPDGAAAAAGLRAGDRLERVDGAPVAGWDALSSAVRAAGERPLHLTLLRPDPDRVPADPASAYGVRIELTVAPAVQPIVDLGMRFQLAPNMTEIRAGSLGEALRFGTVASLDLVKQLYVTLKRLLTGEVGAKNLSGIIGISMVSYQAAQRGPSWFWYFLALLSVNLAFVNLLPIPVLDGGHLLFLLIEKVKGSPVSTRVLGYSQILGLVFVLLLVLFVTYNDILRLL